MEEKFLALQGGIRPWWDVGEEKLIKAAILYLAQGCPDWGERGGKRNNLCTFCPLPHAAVAYRQEFYGGRTIPQDEHVNLFRVNFRAIASTDKNVHTIMIFNAGSFLAETANAPETQQAIMREVAEHPTIKRVVVESRAELITDTALKRLVEILEPAGKHLTIRVGVETQNDHLRLKVLRKGHSRRQLHRAVEVMKGHGVTSGGYVLLNPAPKEDLERIMSMDEPTEADVNQWAIREAEDTIDWILGSGDNQLGMDEAYFCSTNVGVGTPLEIAWREGRFRPASLWMVFNLLLEVARKYQTRVHLLPFKDEPELLAVPSNHVPEGIPQDLSGAVGCDREFHEMLNQYREIMNPETLVIPACECRPNWLK